MNKYKACMVILTLCVVSMSNRTVLGKSSYLITQTSQFHNNSMLNRLILAQILSSDKQQKSSETTKDQPISEYKNLPRLNKSEYVTELVGRRLTLQSSFGYLKQLLKAVMYLDHRVRILEGKEGIGAPLLKEVKNVRDALKKITVTDNAVVETQAATVAQTPAAQEASDSQD
jgi:hypothetical protein